MGEIKYGTFKIGTSKRPEKNVTNNFRINFSLYIRSRKNDAVNVMPENVGSGRILTKLAASVFHGI